MEPSTHSNQDDGVQAAPIDMTVERKAVSLEIIGEMILLSAVAGFFIYIGVSALNWQFSAILTPAIAIVIGTPFLIWRIIHVIRMGFWVHNTEVTQSQIMDIGFRVGQDRKGERQRFIRIFVAIGVLYAGIWILGFHITLPLWIFGYMYWFGKVRFVWAALIGLMFLGFIVGIYDMLLGAYWNEPLLFEWLK
jgi:ABC-type amino acid transport system permease subunit